MSALGEILSWDRLPKETQPIAALMADGWTQGEIVRLLGYSGSTVAQAVSTLRTAMLAQLEERDDDLSRRLLAHADELGAGRSGTRRVAA